jgi:L-rhamnose isomerase
MKPSTWQTNWPGTARDVYEELADAAFVHRLTGIAPSVALHIPWDFVNDWHALRQHAAWQRVQIGAINPNVFQDDAYKFGSAYHASDYPVRVAEERGSGAGSGGFRFREDPKVLRDP